MMTKLRESTAIIMWIVILAFVGLIVIEWGADYSGRAGTKSSDAIGTVDGEQIPLRYFQESLRNAARNRKAQGGDDGQLVREVWDAIVSEALVRQQVQRLGIEISDEEVAYFTRLAPPAAVQALPTFQKDGQFAPELYQQFLTDRNTYSDDSNRAFVLQVEQMMRSQLLNQRLQNLLLETVRVTPQEVRQFYIDRSEKATVDYAYAAATTVPEEAVALTETDIQAHYQELAPQLWHPEQVRVSLVLFPRAASAADSAAVAQEIQRVRAEIVDGGADFADMATATSEDEVSAAKGGDLGSFGRGSMVPDFEAAAFALAPGEVSLPVQTRHGWHLIKCEERLRDADGAEQVHARHILLKVRPSTDTEDELQDRVDKFRELAAERGLKSAAAVDGLEVRDAGFLSRGAGLPGLGVGTEWIVASFFDAEPGALSQTGRTELALYVAELQERRPEGTVPLEEARAEVERSLRTRKRAEMAGERLRAIRQAVAGGQEFAAAVAAAGFEVRTTAPFSREEFVPGVGRGSAFVVAAFELTPGQVSDVVVQPNGTYLLRLKERTAVDENTFAEGRVEAEAQLLNARRREALEVWFTQVYDSADIQDRRHLFYTY